jgi:hypothetical protein
LHLDGTSLTLLEITAQASSCTAAEIRGSELVIVGWAGHDFGMSESIVAATDRFAAGNIHTN